MNFLQSKAHNRLESERVDKLTYTYINTRTFRRINMDVLDHSTFDFNGLTEEEVELEEELLHMEEMSDTDGDESWFIENGRPML